METQAQIITMLQYCCKDLAKPEFINHGNTEPMLFVQVPFRGTCAMIFLKEVYHPSETVACMNLIHDYFKMHEIDICIVANDLTTLEINI